MGTDNGGLVMEKEPEDTYTYEIRLSVSTCYINSTVDETFNIYDQLGVSDQEWDEMTEYEQCDMVDEYLNEWVWQNIDTGWEVLNA